MSFGFIFWNLVAVIGGLLSPSFFLCGEAAADTITLKNGKDLKGLVVEQHADRVILSTEKGEVPIKRSGIKKIDYDEAEQNFLQVGQAYEARSKLGEALAYYQKALEINPNFEEASTAAARVRNRFWAAATEGPRSEIEKRQTIYDAWGKGQPIEKLIRREASERIQSVRNTLGFSMEKEGDWIQVTAVDSTKEAYAAGVRKNDRLVSMDGQSLRYLDPSLAATKFLSLRFSNFILEFERDVFFHKTPGQKAGDLFGMKLHLQYEGTAVRSVKPASAGEAAGVKAEDLVVRVNGTATRYLALGRVIGLIQDPSRDPVVLTVRRRAFMTRGG